MPYSDLTYAQAVAILASRLQDPSEIFWSQPNELLNAVIESVRLYQSLTGSYKQQVAFQTVLNTAYYDLPTLSGSAAIAYTATDVEVINNVLAALLEPPITYPTWTGTGQFTLAQLQAALQRRLDRFLGETGCRVIQQSIASAGELNDLPAGTLDVRRAAWALPPTSFTWAQLQILWQNANFPWDLLYAFKYPLGRMDEWSAQAYLPGAAQNPDQPVGYSVFSTGPLQLRLIPPPSAAGDIDVLTVPAGPTVNLNPSAPVTLNIPDDLSAALKWGVLADLLGSDGPSRDYARAAYAEQRFAEYVQVAKIYPSVLTAAINNISCGIGSVFDLDFYQPDWQQTIGAPGFVGMCGRNLACVGQVPDLGPASANYGVSLWMCANAPVTGYLQVSRDALDPVLDYAQHIASFKMAGAEFDGTTRMYSNFIQYAMKQNGRLNAVSFYKGQLEQPARKDAREMPRMYA